MLVLTMHTRNSKLPLKWFTPFPNWRIWLILSAFFQLIWRRWIGIGLDRYLHPSPWSEADRNDLRKPKRTHRPKSGRMYVNMWISVCSLCGENSCTQSDRKGQGILGQNQDQNELKIHTSNLNTGKQESIITPEQKKLCWLSLAGVLADASQYLYKQHYLY